VDGGSRDGTVEFWQERGFRVVHQTRPGRGEAFRVGFASSSQPWLCFFSPDGNEDPGDIPRLLSGLEEGFDLVIASRFMEGSRNEEDVHWWRPRAWANRFFTWLANVLFSHGPHLTDTINGYRAITREVFARLSLTEAWFPIEYQMSIRALKHGLRIIVIPTIEGDRIGGESKAHSLTVGLGHVKVLLQEIVRPV
jgi:glycosyltransferase involved in cell wall biosynthesis